MKMTYGSSSVTPDKVTSKKESEMETNNQKWLLNFWVKMNHGRFDIVPAKPILLKEPKNKPQIHPYKGTQIFSIKDDTYHLINPFDYVASNKYNGCLEQSLVKKYSDYSFVTNDSDLDKLMQKPHKNQFNEDVEIEPYHVVLLNAIPDFVTNYYPTIGDDLYDDLSYPVQCLAFIDDNGSIFCALPAMIPTDPKHQTNGNSYDESYSSLLDNVIVENVTVQQIMDLLNEMPLLRPKNNMYPFYIVYDYSSYNKSLSMYYDNGFLSKSYANHVVALYVKNNNFNFITDIGRSPLHNMKFHLGDMITNYLYQNVTVGINCQGLFKFHITNETSQWKSLFEKVESLNLCEDAVSDNPKFALPWKTNFDDVLHAIIVESNLNISLKQTGSIKSEPVKVNMKHKVTSIAKAKGFNEVLSTMSYGGSAHCFYINDGQIVSLYGNSNLELIETGDLNE